MATIFLDGFDDYGLPVLSSSANYYPKLSTLLSQRGWSDLQTSLGPANIAAPLSSAGYSIAWSGISLGFPGIISKTLPNNYSRLIGGFRFTSALTGAVGCVFLDSSTAQCSIMCDVTSGIISIYQGNNGTVLQHSLSAVAANTVHYLEFGIIFGSGSSGGWTIWLDGVQIATGTGTTIQSTNSYANVFQFTVIRLTSAGSAAGGFDDLYLFDNTTAYNNTVLLTNPVVVTQQPIGDFAIQFTNNGNAFGNVCAAQGSNYSLTANSLYLAQFTPNVNCAAEDVVVMPNTTNAGANFKGVIYSDSSGSPHTLLSSGTQVTGCTAGTPITLPLVTPQALTAGTPYWIGLINDTTINLLEADGNTHGEKAANTYTSGAPGTAPSMTTNQADIMLYAACAGAGTNWESVALNPPVGDASAVTGSTVNETDYYVFPSLPTGISQVYSVEVSANARLGTAGSHTIDLAVDSGGTGGTGSKPNQALTTSYAWYDSYFDTDPHTTLAWSPGAVSVSYAGMILAS